MGCQLPGLLDITMLTSGLDKIYVLELLQSTAQRTAAHEAGTSSLHLVSPPSVSPWLVLAPPYFPPLCKENSKINKKALSLQSSQIFKLA